MLKVTLPKELPPLLDKSGARNISVIQIICEGKFLITKTVGLSYLEDFTDPWLVKELKSVYGKYQRGGIAETNLYYPLIRLAYKMEHPKLKIEVLYTTTDGYEALKYELTLLEQWFGKPECLNRNNIPYIPKTTHAKKGSNWLTQNQMLNFRKLLKKYEF